MFDELMQKQAVPPARRGGSPGQDLTPVGPRYYDMEFFRIIGTFAALFFFLSILSAATFRDVDFTKNKLQKRTMSLTSIPPPSTPCWYFQHSPP